MKLYIQKRCNIYILAAGGAYWNAVCLVNLNPATIAWQKPPPPLLSSSKCTVKFEYKDK